MGWLVFLFPPSSTWLVLKTTDQAEALPFLSHGPRMNLARRPINKQRDLNLEGLAYSGEKYCFFHILKKCFYYLPPDKFRLFTHSFL